MSGERACTIPNHGECVRVRAVFRHTSTLAGLLELRDRLVEFPGLRCASKLAHIRHSFSLRNESGVLKQAVQNLAAPHGGRTQLILAVVVDALGTRHAGELYDDLEHSEHRRGRIQAHIRVHRGRDHFRRDLRGRGR